MTPEPLQRFTEKLRRPGAGVWDHVGRPSADGSGKRLPYDDGEATTLPATTLARKTEVTRHRIAAPAIRRSSQP